eukprot:scaffold4873_cov74-Phaeocystis_antarctica.AAC.3
MFVDACRFRSSSSISNKAMNVFPAPAGAMTWILRIPSLLSPLHCSSTLRWCGVRFSRAMPFCS